MIETKVPKDVRSYKTKIIGPFTIRQLICLGVVVVLDAFLYFGIKSAGINFNLNIAFYGLMFFNLPILAFMFEPHGVPMEKYIKMVILPGLFKPNKRKAETLLYEQQKMKPLTKKEKDERMKKIKQIGRKNPDLKAYM